MKLAKFILKLTGAIMIVVGAGLAIWGYWDQIKAFADQHCPCKARRAEMADYVD